MTTKPTITRHSAGLYYFTGWIADNLVQYSLLNTADGWTITKTYGQGPVFYTAFKTKRDAVTALVEA